MRKRFLSDTEDVTNDESLLNLTPLIDIVFILLITFILIAPILKFDRVELAPASTQEKKESSMPTQSRNSITIRVFDDNTVTINNRNITEKDLLATLLSLKKNHPTETPLLFHDKNATFGTYQMVKNAVESAGFEEMDVFLKP
jgi:biopolymer transport protein ExbD